MTLKPSHFLCEDAHPQDDLNTQILGGCICVCGCLQPRAVFSCCCADLTQGCSRDAFLGGKNKGAPLLGRMSYCGCTKLYKCTIDYTHYSLN